MNKIARDSDISNGEVTDEADTQTADSAVEATTDEINNDKELVPDEVLSEDMVAREGELASGNDNDETIITESTTAGEAHDDIVYETNAETNNIDEVQTDDEGDNPEPEGRYN